MNTALLILLVGEMTSPFHGPLVEALPVAFPDGAPEVAFGLEAPAGKNVAWVRVQGDGLEVEITLHTALVQGELRRVVTFNAADAVRDRARAVAFTLAAMVRERDASLRPREPVSAAPTEEPRRWVLDASIPAGFDLPGFHGGAGLASHLRREALPWLELGVGAETALFATPGTLLVQPALFVDAGIVALRKPLVLSVLIGAGATALVLNRNGASVTTWLPVLRLGAEGRWPFGSHHGLRFALSTHLVPSTVTVEVGGARLGTIGAVWVRPELGYFVEL